MKRRREQARCLDRRPSAASVNKEKPVVESNLIRCTDAPIKVVKIGAATERHVLAVVHFAAVGKRVGSGASAQMRTFFEQADAEARLSQRDGGGEARQSAADDQNAL